MERILVTRTIAAAMLGVSPQTVSNYVERGFLTAIPRSSGKRTVIYLYRDEVLERRDAMAGILVSEADFRRILQETEDKHRQAEESYKDAVSEVISANRSKAFLRRLLDLVSVLTRDAKDRTGGLTKGEIDILSTLLQTADLKETAEKAGVGKDAVLLKVDRAVAKLARAKSLAEEAETLKTRIADLEAQMTALRTKMADMTDNTDQSSMDAEALGIKAALLQKIDKLYLSARPYHCLKARDIRILADLVQYDRYEVTRFRNLGAKSLEEIDAVVKQYGLHYGMDPLAYGVKTVNKYPISHAERY